MPVHKIHQALQRFLHHGHGICQPFRNSPEIRCKPFPKRQFYVIHRPLKERNGPIQVIHHAFCRLAGCTIRMVDSRRQFLIIFCSGVRDCQKFLLGIGAGHRIRKICFLFIGIICGSITKFLYNISKCPG